MRALRQTCVITWMNLRSVPLRPGTSSVIVIGIAGVVAVLVSVLAMATGLIETVSGTGRPDRAVVVRAGSNAEFAGGLGRDATLTIMDGPGIRRTADGKPIAAAEALVPMEVRMKDGGGVANVPLRGVGLVSPQLRPELRVVEGRMFRPAVRELIVGRRAHQQYAGLDVGERVVLGGTEWTVTGIFESEGNRHESELFADAETVLSAMRRNYFNYVAVMLDSPESFDEFKEALESNPNLAIDVWRETDYLAQQSRPLSIVFYAIAYVVGGIMAIGALFGALNTMYSAVSVRTVEIATLRALGFGPGPVVISVLAEALLLALAGGVLGSLAAWLLFNGNAISTSAGGIVQLVFPLTVSPDLVVLGVIWACVIGLIGGLFPAIRAARLPVVMALRAV